MTTITLLPHPDFAPQGITIANAEQGLMSLNAPDEDEDDMLDKAWGLCPQSRLACQAKLGSVDVVIEIPKYSINHAKEG
jgi:2Fe-2S ferredoxin